MIKIICVGKIKEKFYKDAIKEYEKRLSKYTKLQIIEVNDEKEEVALKKEAENIMKHINDKDYVITLEIEGKMFSSTELAKKLAHTLMINSNITFIIGGSYGLDKKVKQRSNLSISFSKLTFPHQLFRVLFLEQLYRCFKINNKETYHK